jgi:hypothetical protein
MKRSQFSEEQVAYALRATRSRCSAVSPSPSTTASGYDSSRPVGSAALRETSGAAVAR